MSSVNYGRLYDQQVAGTYDLDAYGLLRGVRALAIAQIRDSALPATSLVLDLGAGTGESLVAIRDRFAGGRFIGVDLSEKMLEIARRKIPMDAHVDDACNAGAYVGNGTVDLAMAHFLTSFVDRQRLFAVARAALRDGGVLSVASTTREALPALRAGAEALLGSRALVDAAAPSPPNGETMAEELRACGFTVTAMDTFRRRLTFRTFEECLQWGIESGFLTQALEVIGMDRVRALRDAPGAFPADDEYVGVAISAVATAIPA
jgi:SAM-dependent methyltransferase